MAFVNLNGAKFYYELHGVGHPVVLISGYTSSGASWSPILGELCKNNFQVLIFDNRGCGQTTDDGRELTIDLMAEDTLSLCDALNLKRPHIIGRSMGGNIAQVIAANYPQKIDKLGILVSSSKWREALLIGFQAMIDMRKHDVAHDIIANSKLSWLAGSNFLNDKSKVELFHQYLLNDPFPQSLKDDCRQFSAISNFDSRSILSKITAPTFIGYGLEDIVAMPYESIYLAKHIANSKLVSFNSGHLILLESARRLSQELIGFLTN